MKNKILSLFVTLLLTVLVFTPAAQAQTATTRTILAAAVTNTTQTNINVASLTGIAPTATAPVFAYVDQELMQVLSVNSGAVSMTVLRGQGGTFASTHLNAAPVWAGAPSGSNAGVFIQSDLGGSCTRAQWVYLPVINAKTGAIFDCIVSPITQTGAATTTSEWVALNLSPIGRARAYKKLAVTVTAYTLLPVDDIVGVNTNVSVTVTVPALTGFIGKTFTIQSENTGMASITVATGSGQTINGSTSFIFPVVGKLGTYAPYSGITIYTDGRNWFTSTGP